MIWHEIGFIALWVIPGWQWIRMDFHIALHISCIASQMCFHMCSVSSSFAMASNLTVNAFDIEKKPVEKVGGCMNVRLDLRSNFSSLMQARSSLKEEDCYPRIDNPPTSLMDEFPDYHDDADNVSVSYSIPATESSFFGTERTMSDGQRRCYSVRSVDSAASSARGRSFQLQGTLLYSEGNISQTE